MTDIERQAKKDRFLEYYIELPIQKLAAGFAGISENTVTNWKKEDQGFCDHIDLAESQWARDNAKRVRSKEWLLERVMKNHFAERKEIEINQPIPILTDDVPKDTSPSEDTESK